MGALNDIKRSSETNDNIFMVVDANSRSIFVMYLFCLFLWSEFVIVY